MFIMSQRLSIKVVNVYIHNDKKLGNMICSSGEERRCFKNGMGVSSIWKWCGVTAVVAHVAAKRFRGAAAVGAGGAGAALKAATVQAATAAKADSTHSSGKEGEELLNLSSCTIVSSRHCDLQEAVA